MLHQYLSGWGQIRIKDLLTLPSPLFIAGTVKNLRKAIQRSGRLFSNLSKMFYGKANRGVQS